MDTRVPETSFRCAEADGLTFRLPEDSMPRHPTMARHLPLRYCVRMKLVIATPLYPPEIGGPATHVSSLEKKLPTHGIETRIVKFSDVRHVPKFLRHVAFGIRVFREARRADAISAFDTVSVGLPSSLAAWLARKPLIVVVPGDYAWEQGYQRFGIEDSIDEFQNKRSGFAVEWLRRLQRFVVRRAIVVVAPSEYFAQVVQGWGVRPEKLRTVYLNVELENPQKPANRPEGNVLVSAGRLVPWKGFDGVIEAIRKLPEWKLVIIGDGPERKRLEALASDASLAGRVTFLGALPRAQVLGWYSVADAFVLNTSFESFSYQVVEALAIGVPVIATSIGSLPELIENGKEGILIKPNDIPVLCTAIESVRSEPDLWRQRVEAGKRKAAFFSTERMVEAFANMYKKLV